MPEPARNIIVGTSGHIDHGKTSLVRALTGTDTDRWAEEKRRGITIDLGFASLELEPGLKLGFVDVPGHERFVKNMLAGVGGIDLVLFVIASDESVMPQTREHFEICRLLGIRHGVVALTKADLVDDEIQELVQLEVAEFLDGSFLEDAPMIPVSSTTGQGLDELRRALAAAGRRAEPRSASGLLRLPIDRVFTMRGFGTVVTGTLTAGQLRVDDSVDALPGRERARVRNLQVHGASVPVATAGQRTAVNLGGIAKARLQRGMCLVEPGRLATTVQLDARVEVLDSAKPLKHGAPVHVHLATAETVARAYILGASGRQAAVAPGGEAYVQLRLDNPILALSGDRFILRQFSPLTTIAGGTVLNPKAERHRKKDNWKPLLAALLGGSPSPILQAICEGNRYGVSGAELTSLTGRAEAEWLDAARSTASLEVVREDPLWVGAADKLRLAADRVAKALGAFHSANPLLAGASVEATRKSELGGAPAFFARRVLQQLEAAGIVSLDGDLVRLADHRIRFQADERAARDSLVAAFEGAGLRVPLLKEFLPTLPVDAARAQRVLAALLKEGELVRVSHELVFHRSAMHELTARLGALRHQRISVGDFKTLADISRKYAIPLLEYLDRRKLTIRDGDSRIVL